MVIIILIIAIKTYIIPIIPYHHLLLMFGRLNTNIKNNDIAKRENKYRENKYKENNYRKNNYIESNHVDNKYRENNHRKNKQNLKSSEYLNYRKNSK